MQDSLSIASTDVQEAPFQSAPFPASLGWRTQKCLFAEKWWAERPQVVNSAAVKEGISPHVCK